VGGGGGGGRSVVVVAVVDVAVVVVTVCVVGAVGCAEEMERSGIISGEFGNSGEVS
jgi:hypothetical protein